MIHTASIRIGALDAKELVTAAVRCWRAARDEGEPVQQTLHAMLARHDCGMLAPVFDSLMVLCEAALGRPIAVGERASSEDERLLIGLLAGSQRHRACIDCTEGMGRALDCALCATRVMLAMTLGTPKGALLH